MGKTKRDQKRRDKKGRILRNGESQRKDGRYAFVYTDCYGKQKFLYSWKLEPTDSLPTGCRPCLALREKEKNIQRDLHDGIVPYGGNLTVLDLVQKYIGQKKGVRHNTQANYDFVINIIKKEEFGTRRIDKIKLSDAKAWFIKLQADGRGYSSIHSVMNTVGDMPSTTMPHCWNSPTTTTGHKSTPVHCHSTSVSDINIPQI